PADGLGPVAARVEREDRGGKALAIEVAQQLVELVLGAPLAEPADHVPHAPIRTPARERPSAGAAPGDCRPSARAPGAAPRSARPPSRSPARPRPPGLRAGARRASAARRCRARRPE